MDYQQALIKLTSVNQEHLLAYYDELSKQQQHHLLAQIENIDLSILKNQQQLVQHSDIKALKDIKPFPMPPISGNKEDILQGKKMISQGMMGCLIVAGGQGTRLRVHGPKGMVSVTPLKQKSLFQLFSEKVAAAGRQAGQKLPLAIMTSPYNHEETVGFFERNEYFGLDRDQISFFSQSTLPFLDTSGKILLEKQDTIALGPDGNGLALFHFYQSGLWLDWSNKGVRTLNFLVIDNPLADPFDAELLGYHERLQNDITVKCILREQAQEKVGTLVEVNDKPMIVEYSELPKALADKIGADGKLMYSCANISLFCFDMDFIKKCSQSHALMPLHKALKAVKYLNKAGQVVQSDQPLAWKFETFIFDVFSMAEKVGALLYPRGECFSPLKNFEGNDSLATVQKALMENDRRVYKELTGQSLDLETCELEQDFYYPTPDFLKKLSF